MGVLALTCIHLTDSHSHLYMYSFVCRWPPTKCVAGERELVLAAVQTLADRHARSSI